jgi:hypothetical protein
VNAADPDTEYHVARLVLLLDAVAGTTKKLDGLTKLAKLDFLLRYPVFLERLLIADGVNWPKQLGPTDAERLAVESSMIRYKYGPWDQRYYPLVGALLSTELAERVPAKGRIALRLTQRGASVATALSEEPAWSVVAQRARLIAKHYNKSGTALKNRIYAELPEAVDRPWWEEIS